MQSNEAAVYDAIKTHFDCDKRRIKFIAYLIVALLKLTNASLAQWAIAINQPTQRATRFKRLQRFLMQFDFSARLYAQFIWQHYGQGKEVVLTLDRTTYPQGSQWVQLLVLGIAHHKMSIPLMWYSTNREGNCPIRARQAVLQGLRRWLKPRAGQRVYLTADREFIGAEFRHKTLIEWGLIPLIRIRANAWVSHRGRRQKAAKLFDCPHWRVLRRPREVYGSQLYLAGKRLPNGDFLLLYSDRYVGDMGRLYALRWDIETLFGAYKSRGFHLESCRVSEHDRLRRLLFVLSLGLVWAIQTGLWLVEQGQGIAQRLLKQADESAPTQKRNVYSLFRHGLDELRDRVLSHRPIPDLKLLLSCH
jgi:hypothetical protein